MDISLIANPGALIEEGCDVKLKSQVKVTVKEKPQEIFNEISRLLRFQKEVLP
jgi:hypothetical protein